MKIYEELDYLSEFEQYNFLNKEFNKLMIHKYENLDLQHDGLFSILAYEIVNYFPICNHEEYLKEIFTHFISSYSDVNIHMELTNTFNQYSYDTVYKKKIFDFHLYKVATIFEYIKLFDLHRKMFDTKESTIQMEEMALLDDFADEASDCLDLFFIGISYYQINEMKKANKYIEKGFLLYEKIEDINLMNNIIYKIQDYCQSQKDICFRQGGWLTDFDDRLFKVFRSHKGYDNYHLKNRDYYEAIICQ